MKHAFNMNCSCPDCAHAREHHAAAIWAGKAIGAGLIFSGIVIGLTLARWAWYFSAAFAP